MSDYWSLYWSQGNLTSFGEKYGRENYDGVLRDIWYEYFTLLKKEEKLLDLGSGNGALIELALDKIASDCELIGVDLAELNINSERLIRSDNVRFISKVNVEDLPFDKDEFSVVISQFSLEYANIEKALIEAVRVLKPEGKFQFICHNQSSIIVKPNIQILEMAQMMLEPRGVLFLLKELIDKLEKKENASDVRKKLNIEIDNLVEKDVKALEQANFFSFLKYLFSSSATVKKSKLFEQFYNEHQGLVLRLSELKNAALSAKGFKGLIKLADNLGLKVNNAHELKDKNEHVLAYLISGYKTADFDLNE